MRVAIGMPAVLLTGACRTPGPGQVDPTRYPWDQRKPASYCVVSLETPPASGIAAGGQNVMAMKCKEPDAH